MPAVGLDYRYPFVSDFGPLGVHTLRADRPGHRAAERDPIGRLPNEDAQSLVFDDTTLFEWDKFSGYDRVEGGVRTNLGGQYSVVTPAGWYANVLFGESIQLAGVNSFRRGDFANVGFDSGLESRRSDFVGRFQLSPNQNISLITRARFDHNDFNVNRFETGVTARLAPFLPLSVSAFYSYYEAQPAARLQPSPRGHHGLGHLQHHAELVRHRLGPRRPDPLPRYPRRLRRRPQPPTSPTRSGSRRSTRTRAASTSPGMSFGGGYQDECTTVSLNYIVSPIATAIGVRERNQTVLLRVELKTLGEADLRQNVGTATTADGIASVR